MNTSLIIEHLRPALQHMVRSTFSDIDQLNANNVSLTILALLAYQGTRPSRNIELLCERLLQKQLANGSWHDELWGTALALLAQHRVLEQKNRSLNLKAGWVRRALAYVAGTQHEKRSNWQGEILETILLCWILPTVGCKPESAFTRNAIDRLKCFQTPEGSLFDLYDTALLLLAFRAGEQHLDMDNRREIEMGLSWLKRWDPNDEAIWCRACMLFTLAELRVEDSRWADSLIESLLKDLDRGMISEDHDEQAMAILAVCSYLGVWHTVQLAGQRVPIDSLVHLLQYEDFLISSRTAINAKLEAVNRSTPDERTFAYTDTFVRAKDSLFSPVTMPEQFAQVLSSCYLMFYEGSGAAKRIPLDLLADDSVIFRIKHLRTSVQHDIHHGTPSAIQKKSGLIESIYADACGRAYPRDQEDFRLVHVYLLAEIDRFLTDLGQYITSRAIRDPG